MPHQERIWRRRFWLESETPFSSGKSDLEDLAKNWRKICTKILKTAGEDGHPHQFGHTCAKRLLVRGVPAGFVAPVLGDSEDIVRKHYSKWIPERQEAGSGYSGLWNGTAPTLRNPKDVHGTRITHKIWRRRLESNVARYGLSSTCEELEGAERRVKRIVERIMLPQRSPVYRKWSENGMGNSPTRLVQNVG